MLELFQTGKNLLLLLVVALVLVFVGQTIHLTPRAGQEPARASSTIALVTRVIDGDTVVIEGGRNVRLLGIDADEKDGPCYEEASDRLEELVLNKQVELEKELRDGDVYGRLLRYIFLDGRNVDLQLVKEGLVSARASYEGGSYDKEFADAEYKAKLAKIGCKWAQK